MSEVFADRFQLTMDRMSYREMRSRLMPILHAVGAAPDVDVPSEERAIWRLESGGTFAAKRFGDVAALGASGQFLAALRAAALLGEFLATLGTEPHRVTVLDATMDVPVDAPPVIAEFYREATVGAGYSLTRKRVLATHVTKVFGVRADGRESGTVYLGSRHADVRLKVYDKQHERFYHGVKSGPGLRYELTLKGGKVTLADVYDPSAVFWSFMQRVLPRPYGVPQWVPGGLGFVLPRRPVPAPSERLRARIRGSYDIADLVALADTLPGGRQVLFDEINRAFPARPDSKSSEQASISAADALAALPADIS